MSDAAEARAIMKDLVWRHSRQWGGQDAAMREIERLYGVPYWTTWTLVHKGRKNVFDILPRLKAIVRSTLEKSISNELHRLKMDIQKNGSSSDLADLEAEAEEVLAKLKKAREVA